MIQPSLIEPGRKIKDFKGHPIIYRNKLSMTTYYGFSDMVLNNGIYQKILDLPRKRKGYDRESILRAYRLKDKCDID